MYSMLTHSEVVVVERDTGLCPGRAPGCVGTAARGVHLPSVPAAARLLMAAAPPRVSAAFGGTSATFGGAAVAALFSGAVGLSFSTPSSSGPVILPGPVLESFFLFVLLRHLTHHHVSHMPHHRIRVRQGSQLLFRVSEIARLACRTHPIPNVRARLGLEVHVVASAPPGHAGHAGHAGHPRHSMQPRRAVHRPGGSFTKRLFLLRFFLLFTAAFRPVLASSSRLCRPRGARGAASSALPAVLCRRPRTR
mmetsp:Transcript_27199/g.68779  ORF Transcript_27199/g.68779 Transcript_27199/m.68779 type:complete len:250 (+) Transcript_27199:35-784(+)